ncbi:MAG: hypothetical protein Q9222_006181 [Ikaeria aurantiellina]
MARLRVKRKIVVIGGGAIGSSTAYFLTRHRFFNRATDSVIILEASQVAGGASGKSGGLLASWATPKCLAPLSFEVHGQLAKEHGGGRRWGYRNVYCAEVDLEAQDLDQRVDQSHSRETEDPDNERPTALDWILPGSLKKYQQIGTPSDSAQVNSYLYTTSMAKLAEKQGAQVIIGRATKINYSEDAGRIVSVIYSADGNTIELEATDIVVAAGPWTTNIFPRAKLLTPRGHSIIVKPSRNLSPHILFLKIEPAPNSTLEKLISPEIYPRPGDSLNDFDTVYSSCPDDYDVPLPSSTGEVEVDAQTCTDIWNALKGVSQQIHDGEIITKQACYKPQIRQHEEDEEVGPMVGSTGIEGVWLATGHDEWGMQNSAGTGLVMSEMIFEGKAHSADCESLDPKHFLEAE